DLLALPGREDVVEELLDTGLSYLRNAGVASVHAWSASAHPYNDVLTRYGFVDSRKKLNFGWWLRPGADHNEFDFLRSPNAAVHIMEGEVLD
ncbi:MAG TPA: hypothetical protein VFS30_10710, partial [Dehalococcoidia bacterium]|nr:hypothetical protein [Dehalococcoidia bacterium]